MNFHFSRVALVTATLLCTASASWAGQTDTSEPPAEYILEVNGKAVPVTLDQAFTLPPSRRRAQMKLTQKPYRTFDKSKISFDYPLNYVFDAEKDEDMTTWTISRPANGLVMFKVSDTLSLWAVLASLQHEITKGHDKKTIKTTQSKISLAGRGITGRRISIAGEDETWEIYHLATPTGPCIVQFFDMDAVGGRDSAEFARLKQIVSKTFRTKK